jgi:hypothetical protein
MKSRRRIAFAQGPGPRRVGRITAGICDRRNGVQGSVCTAAILSCSCPLWVKSVISKRGTDVGFTPNSDRESDVPAGRYVPITTKVQCSNMRLFDYLVGNRQHAGWDAQTKFLGSLQV